MGRVISRDIMWQPENGSRRPLGQLRYGIGEWEEERLEARLVVVRGDEIVHCSTRSSLPASTIELHALVPSFSDHV